MKFKFGLLLKAYVIFSKLMTKSIKFYQLLFFHKFFFLKKKDVFRSQYLFREVNLTYSRKVVIDLFRPHAFFILYIYS
jgi:hypothetical protein